MKAAGQPEVTDLAKIERTAVRFGGERLFQPKTAGDGEATRPAADAPVIETQASR